MSELIQVTLADGSKVTFISICHIPFVVVTSTAISIIFVIECHIAPLSSYMDILGIN